MKKNCLKFHVVFGAKLICDNMQEKLRKQLYNITTNALLWHNKIKVQEVPNPGLFMQNQFYTDNNK